MIGVATMILGSAPAGAATLAVCATTASPPRASFAVMLAAFIILAGLAIRRTPPS